VAEAECRRAADAAEEAYAAAFRDDTPADEAALEAEHRRALEIAAAAYEVWGTFIYPSLIESPLIGKFANLS